MFPSKSENPKDESQERERARKHSDPTKRQSSVLKSPKPQPQSFFSLPQPAYLPGTQSTDSSSTSTHMRKKIPKSSTPPSPFARSPLSLSRDSSSYDLSEGGDPLTTQEYDAKERLYVLQCFFDREQIELFFNSDLTIAKDISNDNKKTFFRIILHQLTSQEASKLLENIKHRIYIKNHLDHEKQKSILAYLKALAENKKPNEQPYTKDEQLVIIKNHLLQSMCESEYFMFSLFCNNHRERFTNELAIFALVKHLPVESMHCQSLKMHLNRLFKQEEKLILYPKSIPALFNLIVKIFAQTNDFNTLCDWLLRTKKGRFILVILRERKAWKNLLSVVSEQNYLNEWVENTLKLFSSNQIEEVTYLQSFAVDFLESIFFKEMHANLTESQCDILINALIALNCPKVDGLMCTDHDLIQRVVKLGMSLKMINRIKAWFSFDVLANTVEIKRALEANNVLIDGGQEKLDYLYQLPLLTREQVCTIQNIGFAMALNVQKEQWLVCYKENLAWLIEHWDPNKDLNNILDIRYHFEEVVLDKLAGYEEDAYDPRNYAIEKLPQAMVRQLSEDVLMQYKKRLIQMTEFYLMMEDLRHQQKIQEQNEQPTVKGYCSIVEVVLSSLKNKKIRNIEQVVGALTKLIVTYGKLKENTFNYLKDDESSLYMNAHYATLLTKLLTDHDVLQVKSKGMLKEERLEFNPVAAEKVVNELFETIVPETFANTLC